MLAALTITNLKKVYKNGLVALDGIDLTVKDGDFFALLGPNGAGKTTLIGVTTHLITKTAGEITIFGKNLDTNLEAAKAYIGWVPQEFNFAIFETVEQIVINQAGYYGIPRVVAKQRAKKYLSQLSLWNKRHTQARLLSGGMKRRLMIARALMHEPRLLILDEPTEGVDIEIRRSMWQFLKELNRNGTTIILTTHYLEEAENLCKHVAIINQGKIIVNTNIYDLLDKLHIETFMLFLKQPIENLPTIQDYSVRQIDTRTLEADIRTGQSINDLFAALSAQHITVVSMKTKVSRLEEIFFTLVGSS